jgi:hypothetical protein
MLAMFSFGGMIMLEVKKDPNTQLQVDDLGVYKGFGCLNILSGRGRPAVSAYRSTTKVQWSVR